MANESFSLEIGDSYLRLSDCELNNNLIKITSLAMLEKTTSFYTAQNEKSLNETATIIEKLVQSLKIKKKTVDVIIPDTYTYSQILTMPYLKEKELLSAIKYQADQFIPLPIDETTLDLDILLENKKKNSLLLLIVAAPNTLVERVVSLIEKAGLIPQNIENQASSFARIATFSKINKNFVFINMDYYSTTVYFYNPQLNLITNIYNFKIGLNLFSKEVQVNFNLDIQKADEALKTIGFATSGSLNLIEVLQPALNEYIKELEKFILAIKEKENIAKIDGFFTFNLANKFNQFDKTLQAKLGIATAEFDLSNLIEKNQNYQLYNQAKSSFITVLGQAFK